MEIRILFQELIPRLRGIEATADARRMRSSFINGIKSLPVRVTTG
jgi:cytochrome P450